MPHKNMNGITNIDEEVVKAKKSESKVKQNIFEGKQTKKPVKKKKNNNKYK